MRARAHGYVAVFALIVVALFAATIISTMTMVRDDALAPYAWAGFGVAIAGLVLEAWRDLYAMAMVTVVCAFIGLILTLAILGVAVQPPMVVRIAAAACGAAFVGCAVALLRAQYFRSRYPNVLAQRF